MHKQKLKISHLTLSEKQVIWGNQIWSYKFGRDIWWGLGRIGYIIPHFCPSSQCFVSQVVSFVEINELQLGSMAQVMHDLRFHEINLRLK